MAAVTIPHAFRSLSRQAQPDPDIQATLSDFLTYTEHFPAQLTRALSLIEEQRYRAEDKIKIVHDDTTTYSRLPQLKKEDKRDPVELRKSLSYALEEAENACRMNVEEAVRLHENSQREEARLAVVVDKLRAQPMPPSRDPTPEQQPLTSPNLKRERRMSTRGDDLRPEKASRKLQDRAATKLRGRKIMVPGEVLPPPDPNVPAESISSWSSPRVSPPLEEPPATDKKATPRPRSRTPKPPRSERDKKTPKPRGPRAPGQPGTNAHSAVAGISTSNALLALTQPPDDAVKGSKWLPWMKLTEWEMAKLRKRMKKNAIWVPSQTMVRRELKNLGRGLAGKEHAKVEAQETGGEFVDEHNEPDPTKILLTGEEAGQINALLGDERLYVDEGGEDADQELINRGMRLNEAKKLKRQRLLEEQALQAQIAREQGLEAPAEIDGKPAAGLEIKDEKQKKRKRESTPATQGVPAGILDTPDPLSKAGPPPKKIRLSAGTSRVPLAPAGASSLPKASSSTRNRRAATPPATVKSHKITLKAGKSVSEEPPNRRASLRRSSNASLPNGTPVSPNTRNAASSKSGGRRNRRPAPGMQISTDAEGAKVGLSRRQAAPNRKKGGGGGGRASAGTVVPEPILEEPFEYIDPDEPRYCLCGDVSWGTMIACDNEEACDKEWFHLTCVGLEELPPRRTKWYCPDCRKKLKLGVSTNGLVGSSARR
jgi:hypothetical protein